MRTNWIAGSRRALVGGSGKLAAVVAAVVISASACSGGGHGTSALGGGAVGGGKTGGAPVTVTSISPADSATRVNGDGPITVTFSAPLAPDSPMPTVTPNVPGNWTRQGATAVFKPTMPFSPSTRVTVSIPAGVKSGDGGVLAGSTTDHFTTAAPSVLRAQQLFAQLHYLPVTWTPSGQDVAPTDTAGQIAAEYTPPQGSFSLTGDYPSTLRNMWEAGASGR